MQFSDVADFGRKLICGPQSRDGRHLEVDRKVDRRPMPLRASSSCPRKFFLEFAKVFVFLAKDLRKSLLYYMVYMQFLGLKPCPPPPPAAAAAAAVPATATTTTTTTSYYSSSCCCHWLLRCAPRNPPMTPQFLAKDSRKFRESIGECEGLFCGPLPKPSSDRPSKT